MPVSMFLRHWSSPEITELQAFHYLQNRESRIQQKRMRSTETKKQEPQEMTPEQILQMLDADKG